jgi:hypothetical protein
VDTDRPDDLTDSAAEPVAADDTVFAAAEPVAAPRSRLVLGTLAGLGVVLVGIVVWSLLYAYLKRDYVGVSVVFALGIGYVVREVSRRSDLTPRVVSALLAVVLCVFGSVVAQIANTAREFHASFWDLLTDLLPDTFTIVSKRTALTYVIFAAAVVVAFLSAGPSKPKAGAAADPAEPDVVETD